MSLWMADCTPLMEENFLAMALPHLDAARQTTVMRQKSRQARAQVAAAGLLLTHCFGQAGQPPRISHGAHGKPFLTDMPAHFNLSHTGNSVFLLTAEVPVGLDAQRIDGNRPSVAERCFTPPEQAWLAADPEKRFARMWALKEAYLKYTGFGLVLPMSSFTVPLPPAGYDAATACYWQATEREGIAIAACGGAPIPPLIPETMDVLALLRVFKEE